MKILLVTDVPPCTNYTAGMVLGQVIKVLPKGSVACFCVVNPELQNIQLDPELRDLPLEFAAKPREAAFPRNGISSELKSYLAERFRQRAAIPDLVNRIADYAHRQNVDTIWAVLQGQTMVRLASRVADRLKMPLFCHVWDPLTWWLTANRVDRWTRRQALADFDAVIRQSQAVATASPAMSKAYQSQYGIRSVALIACHDQANGFTPPGHVHDERELVIGMAGQFYANAEWQTLVKTLNHANWVVGGRTIRLLVLGHSIPRSDIPEGKVEFLGWKSQQDAIRILSEQADVLYCPYPFDASMGEVARLSFPSKLASYFAAGRPVLLHGPSDSSPARYLAETGAGLVTTGSGISNVYNAIERLAEDQNFFADLASASQRIFARDFTLERMRERVLEFLGVDEHALEMPETACLPLDVDASAARLPPPREAMSSAKRVRRAILAAARQTPLRPIAEVGVRGVHAYYRQKGAIHRTYYHASERIPWVRRRRRRVMPAAVLQKVLEATLAMRVQHSDATGEIKVRLAAIEAKIENLSTEGQALAAESQQIKAMVQHVDAAHGTLTEMLRDQLHLSNAVRDLDVANASLVKQLEGSDRAYKSLAEVHRTLNRRFDSVASASLAKLDMLSQALITTTSSPGGGDADGASYLDLLEMVLTGEALSDPSIGPWAKPGFAADTRLIGRDWPQNGLTMIGRARLRNIRTLVERTLREGTPGDLIETGVWRGGACIYMRAILRAHNATDRVVWVADSFQGLPKPNEQEFSADTGDTHHTHPELSVSADQVRANFARFGLLDDQVRFLEGWFKDTLPAAPIKEIAVLRLDGDMYESTWQSLEALYHKVSTGGFIIVDDYILPACAQAIEEWRAREKITAPLQEVDGAAVFWQKL